MTKPCTMDVFGNLKVFTDRQAAVRCAQTEDNRTGVLHALQGHSDRENKQYLEELVLPTSWTVIEDSYCPADGVERSSLLGIAENLIRYCFDRYENINPGKYELYHIPHTWPISDIWGYRPKSK